MEVQTVNLAPIPVVMIRHTGPYEGISPVFDQLWQWVNAYGIPAEYSIGIYWDNPDYVSANKLRSAACIKVPEGYTVVSDGGLPLERTQIRGGNYAKTRFVGPYDALAPVWTEFTSFIENRLGATITDDPAFEAYLNDPATTAPADLITELYMPIR